VNHTDYVIQIVLYRLCYTDCVKQYALCKLC